MEQCQNLMFSQKSLGHTLISVMADLSEKFSIYSWTKVIPIESAIIGTVINGLRQVHHRINIRSQYTALTSKSETDPTGIYLGAGYLPPPWNLKTPEI
ncbi:unnamed protein product [Hymenolepis diminuta]|nr:unnamed protein product [Hymenolepis diminuta]